MRRASIIAGLAVALLMGQEKVYAQQAGSASQTKTAWRAVHLFAGGKVDLPLLKKAIDQALRPLGVNVIVLEINYTFDFKSHPELREGTRWARPRPASWPPIAASGGSG